MNKKKYFPPIWEPDEPRYSDAGIPLHMGQDEVITKKEFQSYKELEDMEADLVAGEI